MIKWEYKIVDSRDVPGGSVYKGKEKHDVEVYLNKLGRDGWEIINLDFRDIDERFEFSGVARRELTLPGLQTSLLGTAETSAMVFMIFLGADMMNATLALTAMPAALAGWVSGLPLSPLVIVAAVLLFYVALGCVMDELSMLLLTIPVVFPAIMSLELWGLAGQEKAIWFGILVLMTVGIGLIAPPVGLNVYVVNKLARDVPMSETYRGVIPFLAWDALRVALLLLFPVLSLGLVRWLFA